MHILPYILWQINFKIEKNFKFDNNGIKPEYVNLRKPLVNWFFQCNTQDENGNDDVAIIE